jgi:hypothetical protein
VAEVVYLNPGDQLPRFADEELWITVEASDDGRFFGTGFGRNSKGEAVFYASLPQHDHDLESALAAAQDWATSHGVTRIWVQTEPWRPDREAN